MNDMSALHYAGLNGNIKLINILLYNGSSIDPVNDKG